MDIKKYNIIFTDMAKQDLKEIYNYIFEKLAEPQIAIKLMKKIEAKIIQLNDEPYRCMEIHIKSKNKVYRRLVVENYVVLYRVIEEKGQITIFHIFNSRKNYLE